MLGFSIFLYLPGPGIWAWYTDSDSEWHGPLITHYFVPIFSWGLKGSKVGSGHRDALLSTIIHILNSLFKRLLLCYSLQMGLITLLCFHFRLSFGRFEGWLRALGCPAECRLGSPGFWTWSDWSDHYFRFPNILVWFKYETCEEGVSGLVLIQNRGVRWGIWCRMMLFQRADCNET